MTAHHDLFQSLEGFPIELQKIYQKSFTSRKGLTYGLIRTAEGKKLVVWGENDAVLADPFQGKCYPHTSTLKICDLSPQNAICLMELFPYTKPVSLREHKITIGTGDRLGVATPGHIRAVQKFGVRPVLAQQSVRENTQTGRSFEEVVSDAAWAVFQENYQDGYGADGDHLKSLQEIKNALDAAVSMITLKKKLTKEMRRFCSTSSSIRNSDLRAVMGNFLFVLMRRVQNGISSFFTKRLILLKKLTSSSFHDSEIGMSSILKSLLMKPPFPRLRRIISSLSSP
jgi:hypothetical protein